MSEGSIFKRFATKEALFREAIGIPDIPLTEEIEGYFQEGTIEDGLERVGLRLIELFRELLPRMMMLWANSAGAQPFEALRCIEGGELLPLRLLRTLSAHLEQQARLGRLRNVDPEILARVLIGSTHNFVFFEVVGVHVRQPLAASSFVRSMVDLLLRGAAAPVDVEERK